MKNLKSFLLEISLSLFFVANAQNPRIVSECTVVYSLSIENGGSTPELLQSLNGASKTVYVKGSKSRTDLVSPSYTLTVINDDRNDTTVVLRQLGNSKYISFLDENKRREKNRRYEGVSFSPTGEKKTILGYDCQQVVARLKDGSTYNVFYTAAIVPSSRVYEYQFKDLPGLALEYETESEDGKAKFKFTAQKISLTPIAAAVFDLPKSGYRVL